MTGALATVQRYVPGFGVLFGIAIIARTIGGEVTVLSPLLLAIAFGVIVANTYEIPEWAKPGVQCHKLFLETGIVLLGIRLTVGDLLDTGAVIVLLASVVVIFGTVYFELIASTLFDLENRARAILAAGISVCGVSAVIAVAGAVDADEIDVTYAIATVLLFDAITLIVVPPLAGVMGIPDRIFGVWAGLTLFSTGPTAAVGFSVSETAGQWATITKLVRNSFIGVLAVVYAVRFATASSNRTSAKQIWRQFPKFLLGFLVIVLIANAGVLSSGTITQVETTREWLFALTFVGLGFDIEFSRLRSASIQPVVLVAVHLLTVGVLTFVAVELLL